jgi:hypothetical protein
MIDAHVRIGQFNEIWYEPELVIQTVLQSGVGKMVFSSTTTYRDQVSYAEVEKEISAVLSKYGYASQRIRPLLWYNPDYPRLRLSHHPLYEQTRRRYGSGFYVSTGRSVRQRLAIDGKGIRIGRRPAVP